MYRGLKHITPRPSRFGGYEGNEASTGVSWWISHSPMGGWVARRDNELSPSIRGRTLADIDAQLGKQ